MNVNKIVSSFVERVLASSILPFDSLSFSAKAERCNIFKANKTRQAKYNQSYMNI